MSVTNSISSLIPNVAAQWHPTKNGSLTPDQVVAQSAKKYWWQCTKGEDHEWLANVSNRARLGTGCPCCAGQKASVTNSLASLHPDVAVEWHPTKNNSLSPDKVVAGSQKKYWWKCPNGEDHEWNANVGNRTRLGRGCPYCNVLPRSIPEINLMFELAIFFDIDVEDRKLAVDDSVMDCDIIIRQRRLIVEFDNSYWHIGARMYKRDLDKTEALQKAGWKVIRVREEPLKATSSTDISVPLRQDMKLTGNAVLLKIEEILGGRLTGIEHYLNTQHLQNSVASKKFARHLMRSKATQKDG